MADLKTGYLVGGMPLRQQLVQIGTAWIGPGIALATVVLLWESTAFGPNQAQILYGRAVEEGPEAVAAWVERGGTETTLPEGFVPSLCNAGGDDALDNDCSPAAVELPSDDTEDLTIDFGYQTPCTGTLGDFVWNDLDRDGIQDAGEPGIEGVVLTLTDASGAVLDTQTTGPGGAYQFMGLCAGEYTVTVDESTLPMGLVASPCNAGDDDAVPTSLPLDLDGGGPFPRGLQPLEDRAPRSMRSKPPAARPVGTRWT